MMISPPPSPTAPMMSGSSNGDFSRSVATGAWVVDDGIIGSHNVSFKSEGTELVVTLLTEEVKPVVLVVLCNAEEFIADVRPVLIAPLASTVVNVTSNVGEGNAVSLDIVVSVEAKGPAVVVVDAGKFLLAWDRLKF